MIPRRGLDLARNTVQSSASCSPPWQKGKGDPKAQRLTAATFDSVRAQRRGIARASCDGTRAGIRLTGLLLPPILPWHAVSMPVP
jgi:hypothetical protein